MPARGEISPPLRFGRRRPGRAWWPRNRP